MECRGKKRRQWIVDNYNVVPVAHIQLLKGQTKHSDAGQIIENDYYIFEATHKVSGKKEIIQCGMGASRDFLRLLNHEGLPLFNPLHGEKKEGNHGRRNPREGGAGDKREEAEWNPVAEQLYHAIMWVIVLIDAKPNTPIFEIREKVYKYRYKEPFESQVKAVNTIISRNIIGKTLTEKIGELRAENAVRDDLCQFDMLIDIIGNVADKEGNPLNIEPFF